MRAPPRGRLVTQSPPQLGTGGATSVPSGEGWSLTHRWLWCHSPNTSGSRKRPLVLLVTAHGPVLEQPGEAGAATRAGSGQGCDRVRPPPASGSQQGLVGVGTSLSAPEGPRWREQRPLDLQGTPPHPPHVKSLAFSALPLSNGLVFHCLPLRSLN